MESYKIWAALNIKGDAIEKMKIFQESIRVANYNLSLLNVNLDKFARTLTIASPGFANLAKSFSVINKEGLAGASVLSKYDSALLKTSINTERLARNTAVLSGRLKEASIASSSGKMASFGAGAAMGGGIGMGTMIGGYAAYSGLHHGFEANKEYQQTGLQLSASGATSAQLKEAMAMSLNAPKGVSSIEMMKVINTAFMASRNFNEAKMIAPMLAETELGLKLTYGKQMTTDQMQNLMKFAEFRAGSDMSQLIPNLDVGSKIVSAGGFTIKPTQLAAFMRRGASVASTITPEGLAKLEPVIQELGGPFVGTALQTQLMAMIHGSVSNKRQAGELSKYGFAHTIYDPHGRPLATEWNKKWIDLFKSDPQQFVKAMNQQYLSQGVKQEDLFNHETLALKNTPGRLIGAINKNMGKSDLEAGLFASQLTGHSSYLKGLDMPAGASERFSAASSNLALAFGKLTAPGVISSMNAIAKTMEVIAKVLSSVDFKKTLADYATEGFKTVGGYVKNNISDLVIAGSTKASNGKMSGDVYLDNKKVGRVLLHGMSDSIGNSGSIGGTTGHNGLLSPASSALTNYGTP